MGSFLPNKIISKPDSNHSADSLNFIDLFCGCGGFTLGMERAGFTCLSAIDFNVEAVATLQANLSHIKHVLHRDLAAFGPELSELIGVNHVDVVWEDLPVRSSRPREKLVERIMANVLMMTGE